MSETEKQGDGGIQDNSFKVKMLLNLLKEMFHFKKPIIKISTVGSRMMLLVLHVYIFQNVGITNTKEKELIRIA